MAFDAHNEYRAALALKHTPGIGPRTWKALADYYPFLTEACSSVSDWAALGLARQKQADAFRRREWKDAAELEYRAVQKCGCGVLVCSDPRFPRRLAEISDPPLFLYYRGNPKLLNSPCVAIVGARQCSSYGLRVARHIGEELSRFGVTVVSGMASGIDRQAHLSGLEGPGSTIAVLGTGPDRIYPSMNRDIWEALQSSGLIVTEFPPGTGADQRNFPVRNRIISGLSLGVLVAEAAAKSGSLITARLAMEQGRDVFALPGPLTQPTFTGCHELIRQGAMLVQSAEDILRELHFHLSGILGQEPELNDDTPVRSPSRKGTEGASDATLPAEEKKVFGLFRGEDRLHIDEVGRAADLESASVSRILLQLELKGLVRRWPGMYYSLS